MGMQLISLIGENMIDYVDRLSSAEIKVIVAEVANGGVGLGCS